MYKSLTIKNFRCFKELTLSPLDRVNLIVGMNNVGKTALLEAIFMHIGSNNPNLALTVDSFRGIEQIELNSEEMWGWLFHNRHIDETIELKSHDTDKKQHTLKIYLAESKTSTVASLGKDKGITPTPSISPTTLTESLELKFDYREGKGKINSSCAFITNTIDGKKSLNTKRAKFKISRNGVFIGTHTRHPKEDAERYSKLERSGRIEKEVLPILKHLEPRLSRLSLLSTGGVSTIHGDIGIGVLVPLAFMGEGVLRLLKIVLAIANYPNGVILIDEIENGLHHSVMVKVWKAIAQAARNSNVQVFATTHSWECIQAAHVAFMESEKYDFRLHRLDRIDDDIKAVTYDQDMLTTASATDLEVR
jgi:predicted ATP-dependent endonuclease of OLD family